MRLFPIILCFIGLYLGKVQAQSYDFQRQNNQTRSWWLLESDHFNMFMEDSSLDMMRSILPASIEKLTQIEEKIGYRLGGRINIYIHKSVASLNETYAQQRFNNEGSSGGVTYVKNNDVHVYATGNEIELMSQISKGIADNLLVEMLYGGTIQERIKYATLLQLPEWFHQGLINYLADGWSTESDNLLRDAFNNEQFTSFNTLPADKQRLIGQSLWLYIEQHEKAGAMKDILYLIRLSKKIETALIYVLNKSTKQLYTEWYYSNSAVYAHELKRRIPLNPERMVINPVSAQLFNTRLSPNGKLIAQSYRRGPNLFIDVLNRETDEKSTVYTRFNYYTGIIESDLEVLLQWKNDTELWVVENRLEPRLLLINTQGKTLERYKIEVDLINSFDYYPPKNELVFSGSLRGKSSLLLWSNLTEELVQLTQGSAHDGEPHFDRQGNLYFTRTLFHDPDIGLISGWQTDVYYLFRSGKEVITLTNVTNTHDVNESNPIKLNQKYLSFLSDQNGIKNAYAYKLDQKTFALSDYQTGVLSQHINQNREELLETVLHNGYVFTYVSYIDSSENFGAILHPAKTKRHLNTQSFNKRRRLQQSSRDSANTVNTNKVYFQSPFPLPENVDSLDQITDQQLSDLVYNFTDVGTSFKHFKPTKAITQFNNSNFLTDEFGSRYSPENQLINTLGVVSGVELTDQFNNHVIDARVRTTFNFSIFQYRVHYINRIGKFQKTLRFNAEQTRFNQNISVGKRSMQSVQLGVSRYIRPRLNLRFTQRSRIDRYTPIFIDEQSLQRRNRQQSTFDQGLTLTYNGGYDFSQLHSDGLRFKVNTTWRYHADEGNTSWINTLRMNYGKKIGRRTIWMNRLHLGNSLGSANTIFLLGGNRNQFQTNVQNQSFSLANSTYIQPVYGIRNHLINVRSGTTFGFANTELHYPVHSFFGKKPVRAPWLRNMWILGFADAGTAWFGRTPSDKRNLSNVRVIEDGRFNITVYHVRNPMVYSGGLGLRTKIFGYQIRYDLAWTFDNSKVERAVGRISLGKSF